MPLAFARSLPMPVGLLEPALRHLSPSFCVGSLLVCSQFAQGSQLQLSGWSSQPGPGMMRGCQQTALGISEQSLGEALGSL